MPKFIYAGTHRESGVTDGNPHDSITMFGLTFLKGEAVDVTDAHAIRKLAWNVFFRPAAETPQLPPVAPEIGAALTPAEPQPENALMAGYVAPKRSRRKKETAE